MTASVISTFLIIIIITILIIIVDICKQPAATFLA